MRHSDSKALLAVVACLAVAASVARTILGGQDLNFDLVTYHYYLGFSAFSPRLRLDFLPAGPAGYQSPLPYALLYLLDRAGVAPMLNAAIHACLHSLSLIALFLLTKVLLRSRSQNHRGALLACWLLGAIAPAYWELVGTSFADPLTSAPVLFAVWLVAEALGARDRPVSLRRLAFAGVLAGTAVAMRVHDVIFVLALAAALLALRFLPMRVTAKAALVFALAAGAAWLAVAGPWLLSVAHEFGNPVFPLYNAVFASPDFPAANLRFVSFVPTSVADALMLPFRMATFQGWRFGEKPFPDVRPALLVLAALTALVLRPFRRSVSGAGPSSAGAGAALVMVFFAIAAILWLSTSANSRYGLPVLLLAGPVCGALLYSALPARYALLLIGAAVLWQGLQQQLFFKQYRWSSGPWSSRYFDWRLPAALTQQPATYLSFGYQTASSLAPRLHPRSQHANLVGPYSVGIDQPGAQRIERLIGASNKRVYGLFDYYYTQQGTPEASSIKRYFAEEVRQWGLDFSEEPCVPVGLEPPSPAWQRVDEALGTDEYRGRPPAFLVCRLRPASARDAAAAAMQYRRFEQMIGRLSAVCPGLLGPAASIVRVRGEWQVTGFANPQYRLEFDDDGAFRMQLLRPPYSMLSLGKVTDKGILVHWSDCSGWFARLIG